VNLILTFRIAFKALYANKLRSVLTMLGIIIGVAAVIAMLSIGNGARHLIEQRIQSLGTNAVFVWPGFKRGRNRGSEGNEVKLTVDDWKAVDRLPEVANSTPMIFGYGDLVVGNRNWSCSIYGITPVYFQQKSWEVAEGRIFNEREIQSAANVVVLGVEAQEELVGASDIVGQTIRLKNQPFKVIGVMTELGSSGYGSRDNAAFVPYTTLMKKLDRRDSISYLSLSAHSRSEVKNLEKVAVDYLNDRYNIEDPENGGFGAFNQAEASEKADESTKIFSMLLGGIASISLVVGGIGIMNIMLVSVTERTREIGIRMAVGARGWDILSQFLVEAVVISVLGGAIGVLLGYGLCNLIASFAGWPPIMSTESVMLAFGTSALIGIFFGFYPALSASRLDPIEALRHE
jgi:putative ABC transport system permease protein